MEFLQIHVFCWICLQMILTGQIGQKKYWKNTVRLTHCLLIQLGIKVLEIPREALFLTGKTFLKYRRNKGTKNSPLPDFFIGAHASVSSFELITRDLSKFKTYFPKVKLIHPH